MPNFGLPLLLNWRPLRKTSYLKIKGLYGKSIYNLQKRSWKGCKNRATPKTDAATFCLVINTYYSTAFAQLVPNNFYLHEKLLALASHSQ